MVTRVKNELYKYSQIFEIDMSKNLLTLYVNPEFIKKIKNVSGLIKLEYVESVLENDNGNLEKA